MSLGDQIIESIFDVYTCQNSVNQDYIIDTFYNENAVFEDPIIIAHGIRQIKSQFHSLNSIFSKINVIRETALEETSLNGKTIVVSNTQIYKIENQFFSKEISLDVITSLTFSDEGKIMYHRDVWQQYSFESPKFLKKLTGMASSFLFRLIDIK